MNFSLAWRILSFLIISPSASASLMIFSPRFLTTFEAIFEAA